MGAFQKLGVRIISIAMYWGLYGSPPMHGNYHRTCRTSPIPYLTPTTLNPKAGKGDLVVSHKLRGPHYRPQSTIILIIMGTPPKK